MKFRPSLLASLVVLSFAALPALGAGPITAGPPPTAVKPVSDTYFGTTVIDPYRWLENLSDPAVQAWFKAQNTYTSAVLATLDPARARLRNRIAELSRANERVAGLDREGDYFFYL